MRVQNEQKVQKETNGKRLILRDLLAIDRTRLANQRTLLAFIAMGLHFVILGIAFAKVQQFEAVEWLEIPLISLAVLSWVIGIANYRKNRKDIEEAYNKTHLA